MGGGPGCRASATFNCRDARARRAGREVLGPIPPDGDGRVDHDASSASTTRARPRSCGWRPSRRTWTRGKPAFNTRFGAFIRGEGGFGDSRGDELADPPKMPERSRRPRGHVRDPCRPGVALPALRRPQPAALRPGVREVRRASTEADPARPVHLRRHRSRAAARAVRLRPREVQERWTRASRSPSIPGDTLTVRCGTTARAARSSRPSPRKAPSSSTAASSATSNSLKRRTGVSRRISRTRSSRRFA